MPAYLIIGNIFSLLSAIANVILCGWTIWQIWQYHKNIDKKSKDI